MKQGDININNVYQGETPVMRIYCGKNTLVWQLNTEWTYEIDNLSVSYSPAISGTKLLSNASNYATVIGRVRSYKNGVLQETKPTVKLTITTTSPYLTVSEDRLFFNIERYGITEMPESNPFGVNDVKYYFSGTTGYCPTVYVEPNKIASTAYTEHNCYGTTDVSYLDYNQTTFIITNKSTDKVKTTYTSGRSKITTQNAIGYLFEVEEDTFASTLKATLAYNESYTVSVGGSNANTYPLIYIYRLSYISGAITGVDHFIYMIHKCQNNTTGMQMYYGTQKVDGMSVESSGYLYIANKGHTSDTTYTWDVSDTGIDIEEMNGVFKIYCDSSTFGNVAIYDNKGNSCRFTINS